MLKLPPLVFVLGYAVMIAGFMAGSFWGMALQVVNASSGRLGLMAAIALMLLALLTLALPAGWTLPALGAIFLLLLMMEWWRERVFDPRSGYLSLRVGLTAGVLVTLGWRWLLR